MCTCRWMALCQCDGMYNTSHLRTVNAYCFNEATSSSLCVFCTLGAFGFVPSVATNGLLLIFFDTCNVFECALTSQTPALTLTTEIHKER